MQLRLANATEVEQAKAVGNPLPLLPLALALEGCFTKEQMNDNFFATLERGYTPINELLGKFSGSCSVVGSGPSIAETHKELIGDVIAINGAIGYLLGQGIVPKFAMIWDCDPICERFAIAHPEVTYLIASRVHPKVFEKLKDCKVRVWHAAGDLNIIDLMNRADVIAKQKGPEPLINGGTAGVTRAIYIAKILGYMDINIYGGDSSYSDEGKTHIQGSLVKEKDVVVSIGQDPAFYFRTTPEWCCQVEEYRAIYAIQTCMAGATLKVHGYGMLKTMHDLLEGQKAHMGVEKFLAHLNEQETARTEVNKAASDEHERTKSSQPEESHACQ